MEDKKSKIVVWGFNKDIEGHEIFQSAKEAKSWVDGFYTGVGILSGDEAWATTGGSVDFWNEKLNKEVEKYIEKLI